MEGELNFLTTAKKTLLEDKGVYSSNFSRWIKSSLPYHVSLLSEKAITTIVLHVHKFGGCLNLRSPKWLAHFFYIGGKHDVETDAYSCLIASVGVYRVR